MSQNPNTENIAQILKAGQAQLRESLSSIQIPNIKTQAPTPNSRLDRARNFVVRNRKRIVAGSVAVIGVVIVVRHNKDKDETTFIEVEGCACGMADEGAPGHEDHLKLGKNDLIVPEDQIWDIFDSGVPRIFHNISDTYPPLRVSPCDQYYADRADGVL